MTKKIDGCTKCPKHGWHLVIGNHDECEACLLEQKELNQAREDADGIDSRMIKLLLELDEVCESIDRLCRNDTLGAQEQAGRAAAALQERNSLISEVQTINQAWLEARIYVAERMC